MNDGIRIDIKGLDVLNKKLENMKQDFAAKSIVSSAYSANKVVQDKIKENISSNGLVDTGLLQKSITRKKIVYAKDGKVVIITGVNKKIRGTDKNGKPRVPWRYANVLEPKYKFTKDAGQSTKQQVVDSFVNKLARKIKKYEKGGGTAAPTPDPQGPE
jgi:hypothetical protein